MGSSSELLSRLVRKRGVPTFLCSDNRPEFVSKAMLVLAARRLDPPRKSLHLRLAPEFNARRGFSSFSGGLTETYAWLIPVGKFDTGSCQCFLYNC
jgi:hypothetical protein